MGLFDIFRRAAPAPTSLLEQLLEAVEKNDLQRLADLNNHHRQEIHDAFPEWRTMPQATRADPRARARYANGLIAIAQLFEQTGDGSLMALLMPPGEENPIVQWQDGLRQAQALIDGGQPQEAIAVLREVLEKTGGLTGTGVDEYRPRTYGMLGLAYFRAGDREKAFEATSEAMRICEAVGDQEGVEIYAANLRVLKE